MDFQDIAPSLSASLRKVSKSGHLAPDQVTRTLVHLLCLAVNGYGLAWDVAYLTENGESCLFYRGFPGKYKYLTFWNQILQTVFFGYSVINDLVGSNCTAWDGKTRTSLQRFRDHVVASIIFPMGTFVVVTFWGIYAVDRELVFPKVLDAIIPSWLNHVMHTTVIAFLLIEKYLVYHHYPSRKSGLTYALGFAAIYQLWILWIAFYADIWVYPILRVLNWPGRIAFFAFCWVLIFAFYMLGEYLTKLFWRPRKTLEATKMK